MPLLSTLKEPFKGKIGGAQDIPWTLREARSSEHSDGRHSPHGARASSGDRASEVDISLLEPWEDPKDVSTLGLYNLHHRSCRVQNRGLLG